MKPPKESTVELIDTHCHLDFKDFDPDRPEVIQRALDAGVTHMVTIGIDIDTSAQAIALAEQYDMISASVGHHPHDAASITDEGLTRLKQLARHPRVVGFGEIGLDFFRDLSPRKVQEKRFDDLIQIGLELGLPLIIHNRDAHQETLSHLSAVDAGRNGGIIHCFSGDYDLGKRFIDLGFHISIPGTVTFPKAETTRNAARDLPLDALLVETDAPFLAPVPRRGRRNEPALVKHTALEIARLRGIEPEDLARATTRNARRVFGLETD